MVLETPLFSVIIPIYNRAHLLARTVRSVLDQTHSDFEVVVVDDGSTDDPASAIARIGDPRIRLIRQDNAGGGAARNAGIDAARGHYIAFLDSDDVFLPHHLNAMRLLLEGTTGTVAYAPVVADRGAGKRMVKPPRPIGSKESMAAYLLSDRGFVQTSALVVPRQIARQVRYREDVPFGQDTDFAIRLDLAGCKFVMAGEPGAVWNDAFNPKRISAGRKGNKSTQWLEDIRSRIPETAYYGYLGWHVAKGVVVGDTIAAFRLYFTALRHGSYSPRLALVVFLQIFSPDWLYRKAADWWISIRHISSRCNR